MLGVVVAATVYVSLRQTKLYRASADVFLGSQNVASSVSGLTQQTDPTRDAITQASLADTPAVAQRALTLAGLGNRSPVQLLASSSVTPAPNADILTFSVTDHDASIAKRLADDYAKAYTNYRRQLDTAGISSALKDITTRLDQLRSQGLDKTNAYADLLDKQEQLSTLQVLQGSNALIVRSALSATQIQPRPVRNGAIAAVLGLLLGLGLVLLREALNTRVRTTSEVQELLHLPQLGRIPEPPRRFRRQNRLVMLGDPHSPSAEAYRILATNLDFVNLEPAARTIMFTSATHAEGKSTTVANLAVAFARAGRPVILVDLDLRKPVVGKMFRLDERKGLTSVALGRDTLDAALEPITLPNATRGGDPKSNGAATREMLDVLGVGPAPPNPAEFVGSRALDEILADLESRAEIVLIDAPPLLNLSDAMTLAGRVDGVVVVTRLPLIRRSALQELRRVLDSAPVAKLGFVATGSSPDAQTYGGYGYGYTRTPDGWRPEREGASH